MDLKFIGICSLALLSACVAPAREEPAVQQQEMLNRYFALYEEEWRNRIENVAIANYPAEARGRIQGSLRLTVSIRKDGSLASTKIDRSSGHDVLDRAAVRIVELASPFPPFPPEIAKDTDLFVITRTWFFGAGGSVEPKQ